ncbi:BrnA antitoxin family protein [Marinivivus vitaminiproducens]|uniref:BrnA antitoxin family protein n=1 Tax=Marinivivus vitaminiproducens TaxID=3035935 RepID=UPI00279B07D3|nr:BrnA antitoxin family protein [Geminicoccaceae bacterium SCSIO 64248]
MAEDDTRHYSLAELRAMRERGETQTAANPPKFDVDEEFWANARPVVPHRPKVHTGLRIDADVLDWFKAQGAGWQTRMNAVLRAYYDHERR